MIYRTQATVDELRHRMPSARAAEPAATKRDAIAAIYRAIGAPSWAAPNLDGLADILRDLSWLPDGSIALIWPAGPLAEPDRHAIEAILQAAVDESARSLTVYITG